MHSDFEWGQVLIALVLLGAMFVVPMLVIWRDQVRDLRRFGPAALSWPVRYGPDGEVHREGTTSPPAAAGVGAPPRPEPPARRPASAVTSDTRG
ncbi:conserved hypothetical protein [Frankia canadensis]|uniref:Uncharacterized protein n=1 Tax=Frankia canadensis TaxID=1836972 RepID=A0A2I2KMH7_9ACTN|nr:hypothetical protein [Frankia canadensis]SNQ46852.1 conserved hypothetical protein [Frankia canadensis]SOU54142.1 conserved hypothetical protein [Frankia canadensis]